jgi:hypothetical protein
LHKKCGRLRFEGLLTQDKTRNQNRSAQQETETTVEHSTHHSQNALPSVGLSDLGNEVAGKSLGRGDRDPQ